MTRKKYNRISKSITIRLLRKEKDQDFRRLVNLTLYQQNLKILKNKLIEGFDCYKELYLELDQKLHRELDQINLVR